MNSSIRVIYDCAQVKHIKAVTPQLLQQQGTLAGFDHGGRKAPPYGRFMRLLVCRQEDDELFSVVLRFPLKSQEAITF